MPNQALAEKEQESDKDLLSWICPCLKPFIGQQFIEFICAVSHNTTADVLEISARVDIESPASLCQRKQGRRRFATLFTSNKEPILSSNSKRSDCSFCRIIIKASRCMLSVVFQIRDQRTKISQRFFEFRFRQDNPFGQSLFNSSNQGIDDGNRLGLSNLQSFYGIQCPGYFFNGKKFLNLFEHPSAQSWIAHFCFIKFTSDMRPAGAPNVAVLPNVRFVGPVFIRMDNAGIRTQYLFCVDMFAIFVESIEAIG